MFWELKKRKTQLTKTSDFKFSSNFETWRAGKIHLPNGKPNIIIRKKGYFHTPMLELIIFDSTLEENIFADSRPAC